MKSHSPNFAVSRKSLLVVVILFSLCKVSHAQDDLVPQATYKFPSTSASPGEVVTVPFIVQANLPMNGVAISVDFDEEILEVVGVEVVYRRIFDADRPAYFDFLFDNLNENPGNDLVEEGALWAVTSLYDIQRQDGVLQISRPVADQDHEIFHIHFRVKDETPVGTVTDILFQDGALGRFFNGATLYQEAAFSITPFYEVKPLYVPGQLLIVGELILFLRGDASGDGVVDMTDAVNCLEYLFLGSYELHCPDAADANDDGELDVTDPISILAAKFLGTIQIPPPNIAPGLDPTEDSLDCSADQETSPES